MEPPAAAAPAEGACHRNRGRRRLRTLSAHVSSAAQAQTPPASSAEQKEAELRAEAASWEGVSSDPSRLAFATPAEIPTIDLSSYHSAGCAPGQPLERAAAQLRAACENIGFHYITGHGVPDAEIAAGFAAADIYHALPLAEKLEHQMDTTGYPSGAGYLPLANWKLPKPQKPNLVEAFVVKREHGPRNVTLDTMPWPRPLGERFRAAVERYAAAMEALAMRMLPIYARALDLPHDYWEPVTFSQTYGSTLTVILHINDVPCCWSGVPQPALAAAVEPLPPEAGRLRGEGVWDLAARRHVLLHHPSARGTGPLRARPKAEPVAESACDPWRAPGQHR